jgi:3-oxoacyl-[acyl-carrier protein] reductase
MDLGLEGKVALLTGASRGLGKAAAMEMARDGARVVISARGEDLDEAADDIRRATGAEVLALRADLTKADDITRLVSTAIAEMGRLDILFANVGGPPTGYFLDLDIADWEKGVELTIMSIIRLCYAVVPHMIERGQGVLIANESNSVKVPIDGLTMSNSLRLAVIGLMKSLANELGPRGIRVNTINPGWTWTERVEEIMDARAAKSGLSREEEAAKVVQKIPLGRMGSVEEYGRAAAWLASPAASFVSGHNFFVDGGTTQATL